MYDRICAAVLLVVAGLMAWLAYQLQVPFQYEPLGPKAFPLILAALIALCALWLLYRPDANRWQPSATRCGASVWVPPCCWCMPSR